MRDSTKKKMTILSGKILLTYQEMKQKANFAHFSQMQRSIKLSFVWMCKKKSL